MSFIICALCALCTLFAPLLVSATPVSIPKECLTQDDPYCTDVVHHCGINQVSERCPHNCGLCPTNNPTVMPSVQPSVSPSFITTLSPTVEPTISPTRYVGCSDGISDELFCKGKLDLCPLFGRDMCRYTCNMCPTESPSLMPTVFPTLLENNTEKQNTRDESVTSASSVCSSSSIISSELLICLSFVFSFLII